MSNSVDITHNAESIPVLAEMHISNSLKSENFQPVPLIENELTSVIRVKRKLSEDPAKALLLTCKRRKLDEAKNEAGGSLVDENIFHFATTLDCKSSLEKKDRTKVQEAILFKKKMVEMHKGSIAYRKHIESANKKVQLVGHKRSFPEDGATTAKHRMIHNKSSEDHVTSLLNNALVEEKSVKHSQADKIEDSNEDIMCNSIKMFREKLTVSNPTKSKEEFVFDYYFCSKSLKWSNHDILDLRPCNYDEFVWDFSDHEDLCEDEDDENEENNWRNDYPDEINCYDDERRFSYDDEDSNCSDNYDGETTRSNDFDFSDSFCDYENIIEHFNREASYGSDFDECDAYWRNDDDNY